MHTSPTNINQKENYHSNLLAKNHLNKALNLYSDMPLSKRDFVIKWKRQIQQIKLPASMPYSDLTSMRIGLPTGIFAYQFKLNDLLSYLSSETISPIQLDLPTLSSHVNVNALLTDDDQPPVIDKIIMLETPLLPRGYLLTGHNEVIKAKLTEAKQLDVYVLSENEFIGLMFDDLSKGMYMFNRDLQNLISTPHHYLPPNLMLHQFMLMNSLKEHL